MTEQPDLFSAMPMPRPNGVPPDVADLFERFALDLISNGWDRYSARAILHRIRWHHHVERGDRDFKCNNNWTPGLARWFHAKHPAHAEFFETRASPGEGESHVHN